MANAVYTSSKDRVIETDLLTASLKVVLIDKGAYTFSAAHQTLADVPSGARVATSTALTGVTTSGGVLSANDETISAVTGASVEAYIVYIDGASDATRYLLTFVDTQPDGATAIAFTPDGGDVTVSIPNGILAVS